MTDGKLIDRAIALHRDGALADAERLYARVLKEDPENVDALHLLGVIRHQNKDFVSAESMYREAVRIQPRYLQAWTNLGMLMQEMQRWNDARKCFREAVAAEPGSSPSWNSLGRILAKTGDLAGADDAYRQAIHCDPENAEAYNNLGTVLARRGDRRGARGFLDAALAKRPGYLSPLINIGQLHREEGRLEEAEAAYRQALALDPNAANAHWGLAHVLLLRGDLLRGWEEYEWRWRLEERPHIPLRPEPIWQGEPCQARQMIVYAEQGLGDAIQCVRYVTMVLERGARVTLLVPQTLVRLFREIPGIDAVASYDTPGISGDLQCSLLSLPGIFGTTLSSIPAQTPVLRAPEHVRQSWHTRCNGDGTGFKVGIAWAGSPTHENDSRRSLDPRLLERLNGIAGVRLYSLQVNDPSRSEHMGGCPHGMVDHTALLYDAAETAGLIEQLDLVVTVDTMIAHLAGALGKTVWVLLPSAPDWRWLLGRNDSPWYATARLFRQASEGDWEGVLERVGASLMHYASPADLSHAIALHGDGRVEEAEQHYRSALHADPDNWEAQYLLAVARYQQQDYQEAIALGRHLTTTRPFFPEAYNTLGNSLRKNGDLAGAEDVFRKAITLRPEYTDAHYNLGGCLCDAWRLEEAAEEFLTVLRLDPAYAKAVNNLGLVRYRQGNIEEAIQYFRHALSRRSEFIDAHWNLSHALLHAGQYGEGWQEFEWRWRMPAFQRLASRYDRPRWNGEDLRGRRLLVWSEQGYGDTLQFVRVLPALLNRGGEVLFECHPLVAPAVRCMRGVTVVLRSAPLPDHDLQIPLLSLPATLNWKGSPPPGVPYLQSGADALSRWAARLSIAGDRLRIGIVWSGSTTNPEGRFRSIPLDLFAGLSGIADVFFVNLQVDEAGAAFKHSPFIHSGCDWTDLLVDFGETAGLIGQLDLVITVDTAVAHLAGALARQVWVLLASACDWRWGTHVRITPWYPTARLYRQRNHGEWAEVIEEVRRDLTLLASQIRLPWNIREEGPVRVRLNEFDPESFSSWNNLGVALLEAGHPREAIAPFQQALGLDPENARGHTNLAFAQLADGQWHEGLENHEWRLKTDEGSSSLRPYPQPRWAGQPLRGKKVFLYAEQGFGDAIQYVRYAWLLAQSGARVVIEVRRELLRLMRHAPGVAQVIVRGDAPPPFDYHSPLLSLPYAFRTTPGTVPSRSPYLIAGNDQLVEWKKRIAAAGPGLRIGVCWSGSASFIADAERSIAADMLCSVLPANDALAIPLVKSDTSVMRPAGLEAGRWIDLTPEIQDFADTAALISYLDLVVTVDTAVAHLAGALGKPVFMVIPFAPDWRWSGSGNTTPWYPGMQLFRQSRRGSWDDPLDRVRVAVEAFARKHAERASQGTREETGMSDG